MENIPAIAITRGALPPTNFEVFWEDISDLSKPYFERVKFYDNNISQWRQLNLKPSEVLQELKKVDTNSSGLNANTLQGRTLAEILSSSGGGGGTAVLAENKILVGDSDGLASGVALSGDATISSSGEMLLINSGVVAGSYNLASISIDAKGRITTATAYTLLVSDIPELAISKITNLQTSLDAKQDTLVSGTNIKTVAGVSLLGTGNVPIISNNIGSDNQVIPSTTNREVVIPSDSSLALKGKTIISDIATPTVEASAILNIESITKGLLIPRVTNAQMTSISSPADNLLVFNTQQSALYRYDLATTSWVALSAGYGIVELTGTTGVPKYYASIKSAHDDATAGQKITLHSNYTETTTNEIILKGVVIDLNEYTYTYDVADDSDVFSAFNTTAGVSHAIVNGKVIKRNGTGTNLILNANKTGDYFKLTGVDFLNEDGGCFDVNGEINGSGSKFVATASGTGCFMGASSAKVKGGYYGNLGAGGNRCSGEAINTEWEAVSGIGCYLLGKASSSVFRSGSNDGLLASGAEIINCEAYSDTAVAADITNSTKAYNLYGESNSNVGIDAEGADLIENCKGVSKSGNGRGIKSADLNINCIAESYGTGSVWLVGSNCELIGCTSISKGASNGYSVNGTGVSIINCKALLSDTGKAGVLYNNRDVYVVNLTVKGSATAETKGTKSNLWTDALDAQGITAIE